MISTINIVLSTFSGLDLPPTLLVPLPAELPVSAFTAILEARLPAHVSNLSLSSTTGVAIDTASDRRLSSLLPDGTSDLLPLRLSAALPGGKGGFGSQLRAAGGRMSSRKNRNGAELNGSNRNLDGRRLRTITEAKSLAEYLATKPEMDRKDKEARRKRWESIVEAAERREEEVRHGKKGVRLDGEWVDKKDEEEIKTRDAILAMMKADLQAADARTGSESDEEDQGSDAMDHDGSASASTTSDGAVANGGARSFFGWDEDGMSEDEEASAQSNDANDAVPAYEGKGKAKV